MTMFARPWVLSFCVLSAAILLYPIKPQEMGSYLLQRSLPIIRREIAPLLVNARTRICSSNSIVSSTSHKQFPFHNFSTSNTMASSKSFIEAVAERRSYYGLTKESTVSDDRIEELVKQTILHTPSPFNVQSTRCVVLLKKEHEKLWDITKEILKTVTPPERLDYTLKRITGFHGGYGTVILSLSYPVCGRH